MIKIGVIGASEGNGHPYSWSAIFNGYDEERMATCPYALIPDYLSQQKFPEDAIAGAKVVSVFTQDRALSEHIAAASKIDKVCASLEELIAGVDAVLLARDDAESHLTFAKPVLDAGLPIYIDKPLAFTVAQAKEILAHERYSNQIFTCSALSYSPEMYFSDTDRELTGEIRYIDAIVPKYWQTYALHLIEPILKIIGFERKVVDVAVNKIAGISHALFVFNDGVVVTLKSTGKYYSPFKMIVCGEKGTKELCFSKSSFSAFKAALGHFINVVNKEQDVWDRGFTLKAIELLELGNKLDKDL